MDKERNQRRFESVYSKKVRAGKRRTYFFDVRRTKGDDFYLTLTESTKKFNGDGYERHKIFLYKEDLNRFLTSLEDVIGHIKTELMPDYDYDEYTRRHEEYEARRFQEEVDYGENEDSNNTLNISVNIPGDHPHFIYENILQALDEFMEVSGFELESEGKPIYGSFYKDLIYHLKEKGLDGEFEEKLEKIFERLQNQDTEIVLQLINSLAPIDEVVIMLDNIILIKVIENGASRLFVQKVNDELLERIIRDPSLLKSPQNMFAAFKLTGVEKKVSGEEATYKTGNSLSDKNLKTSNDNEIYTRIRHAVRDGNLEKTFKLISKAGLNGSSRQFKNQFILQEGKYNNLKRNVRNGSISFQDSNQILTSISSNILNIVDDMEETSIEPEDTNIGTEDDMSW